MSDPPQFAPLVSLIKAFTFTINSNRTEPLGTISPPIIRSFGLEKEPKINKINEQTLKIYGSGLTQTPLFELLLKPVKDRL